MSSPRETAGVSSVALRRVVDMLRHEWDTSHCRSAIRACLPDTIRLLEELQEEPGEVHAR